MVKQITDYFLYRHRFSIGYSLIGIAIVGLLGIIGVYIPGGLSDAEMQSAVTSNQLSFSSFQLQSIVNLPYHLLQKASLTLFGVSTISIKLPSLLLGALSIVGMLILLQSWFKRNVAIITTVLVITAGQLLFVSQNGTPSILYIFWSIWLLVAAMMVSRQARFARIWKLVMFGVAALSLYTPLSIYILLALVSAAVLHPHLRFIIRRLSRPMLIVATVFAAVLVVPLAVAIVMKPSIGLSLLGIPETWPAFNDNLLLLINQYFNFTQSGVSALMTPIYGLGSMLLIILGVYRLATTKYTARSYIITAWLILLLPVLVINPHYVSITFVPVILLMGMGISILLSHWYGLFPLNPYARMAGLIPLAVLIGGMVFSGIDRYMYGYYYDPAVTSHFSNDLRIFNRTIDKAQKTTVVVTSDEVNFYKIIASHNSNLMITTTVPSKITGPTIFTHAAYWPLENTFPQRIVTDDTQKNSDRFYVYAAR